MEALGWMSGQTSFLGLFEKYGSHGKSGFPINLKVCHRDIDWKTKLGNIHFRNIRATYNVRELNDKEAKQFVEKLEEEEWCPNYKWTSGLSSTLPCS